MRVHLVQWASAADWRSQAVCSLIISLKKGIRSDRAVAEGGERNEACKDRLHPADTGVCAEGQGFPLLIEFELYKLPEINIILEFS